MLLGFISVCCLFTLIAGNSNARLSPEILSHDPFNPGNSQNDASKNIFSEVTVPRPSPVENNVVLQNQKPKPCQNSEILVKILNILQKIVNQDSSKGDMVSDVLKSVKENLKRDPANVKSDEILNNLDDLEKLIEVDDGSPKPVLRQYTYRSAPGKLKTKIVFKYELPSISHPNCKQAFEKLIQTAHDAYMKLSSDPMCDEKGQNDVDRPNYKEINNSELHPFNINTNYNSNPDLLQNVPINNSFSNDDSTLSLNSIPQDLQIFMKNNKLNPNNNILQILQNYHLDHKNVNKDHHIPKTDSVVQNPNGLDLLPNAAFYHSNGMNDNDDINQNNLQYYHPNITQKNYDISSDDFNSKFLVNDDKIPSNNNEDFLNNIFNIKYPKENSNSPGYDVPNKGDNKPSYNEITDLLNKYHLAKNTAHKNPEIPNDKSNDDPNVANDKLPFKQNDINGPVLNDPNNPNHNPNYEQYINEIKNLITQNPNNQNPHHQDQNPAIQNEVYHQDLTINSKYYPNKQSNHDQTNAVPLQYYNINGNPNVDGKNPYQFNVNPFNQNRLPYQNSITVNKNGIYQINPNLNNIQNAATYYNGVPYFQKNLANINGLNNQNVQVAQSNYQPDLHHPIEGNTLPNLQHLLSVTNLYKLNDLPHKADIIELTYMLKRSEPLVYQPFYIVKYRLPYTKFLYNVRELIHRKPYLRTNQEKLYQELIALSNVTETSDDLKGYPKEDIVKLTFNNGALVTAKILNTNDTNINEQLKVIQNLNSNLQPEDFLKLNRDNANKYYARTENNNTQLLDSKVNNNSVTAVRSWSYRNGYQYPQPGNNIWNPLLQNNPTPVLANRNTNVINPGIIPGVLASQQAMSNSLPMYQQTYGR